MSDMDREGSTHASRPVASENLALAQLEATFEAAVAELLSLNARMHQLEHTWSRRKPRPPTRILTSREDAIFDLCSENEVGRYYTIRDIPSLHEVAKSTPQLWPRVQSIVTALHLYHQETSRLANEIGLTAIHQMSYDQVQVVGRAAQAILRQPATSLAVLAAKARVLAAAFELQLDQDPWSANSFDDREMLVLVQDLINASPALKVSAS